MTTELMDLHHLFTVNEHGRVIPVIVYEGEDSLLHTAEHPHCDDPTCPCNRTDETLEAEGSND